MLDFIFIIGTSGIGKSTLAQGLFRALNSTCIEQHMVPEFLSRDGIEPMTGELEERTCWENTKAMALCFQRLGYRNIVVSDLDDLRTADIPEVFHGFRYITLKLICSDFEQLRRQMHERKNGLVDDVLQEKLHRKMTARPLLVNEHLIDVAGLTKEKVLEKALSVVNNAEPILEYEYVKPPKEWFYSWVFSNGLR